MAQRSGHGTATDQAGQALAGLAVDQILTKCALFFFSQGKSTAHLVIWLFMTLVVHCTPRGECFRFPNHQLSYYYLGDKTRSDLSSSRASCETPRNPPDDAKCNGVLYSQPHHVPVGAVLSPRAPRLRLSFSTASCGWCF